MSHGLDSLVALDYIEMFLTVSEQAEVLKIAYASGLLNACTQDTTTVELAERIDSAESTVFNICRVLESMGILATTATGYVLTPACAAAFSPEAERNIETAMGIADARQRSLRTLLSTPKEFGTLSEGDQYLFADGAYLPPDSPVSVRYSRAVQSRLPEVHAIRQAGGLHLELGCGLSSNLLLMLQNYPKAHAVGVDISASLLAEARKRAVAIGVSDRIEFINTDAGSYASDALFDTVFWSQTFFTETSRAPALTTAYSVLKPGHPLVASALQVTAPGLVSRTINESWGIPSRTPEELADEVTSAGFTNSRIWGSPPLGVLAYKPRSAQLTESEDAS
jgi:ubiquinone/menaquinone biosynthesis C-methylase UbiE